MDTPAIFFDDELSREPARPSESVARIISAEEDPDAPAWSIGPPTDEPDGHEMQFFEPSPGDLKEEQVEELIRKRVGESSVSQGCRKSLLETILNRRKFFF